MGCCGGVLWWSGRLSCCFVLVEWGIVVECYVRFVECVAYGGGWCGVVE